MRLRFLVYGGGALELAETQAPVAGPPHREIAVAVALPIRALDDGYRPEDGRPMPVARFKLCRVAGGVATYVLASRPPLGTRWIVAGGRLIQEDTAG